jgi:hypothetical protein
LVHNAVGEKELLASGQGKTSEESLQSSDTEVNSLQLLSVLSHSIKDANTHESSRSRSAQVICPLLGRENVMNNDWQFPQSCMEQGEALP